ncbi:PAS domain S-box-containing protein [Prosthecobacter debontii]|uniref:histidine kinase n=1 Tax=Prosthecobacter debontii TaxID=48467 RepID=A0A1T4XRP4_9BACT|nr:PAS domain S-box protein [Prosthecobacter debontii]SKA92230.1 PAS domain S-box-containing protein [Prosthecobacter debontii]
MRTLLPGISPAASGLAILTAGLVLVGWALDIESLKRVFPGLVSMNPLTAIAFLLAAVSLEIQRKSGLGRYNLWAEIPAVIVLIIGGLRLIGYVFDWSWGLDQILFSDKLVNDQSGQDNRMSPNAALGFAFLGTGLALVNLRTRSGFRPAEICGASVLAISLLALLGYLYRVTWLYEFGAFIPMALHTAVLFQVLAVGLLCVRPERGWMAFIISDSPGGSLVRHLFPLLVPVLVVLGWARLAGERHGYFEAEMGTTLYTITTISMVSSLIWWSARSLHRSHKQRIRVEKELEGFFTVSLDMLCIASKDGYFKRINPAFSQTLGYTEEELLSRPFVEFVHPEDLERTRAETGQVSGGQSSDHFENRYLCKDGSWKWLWWKGRNLEETGLIYATARDITEQKEAEEKIRRLNRMLEERAAQLDATNQELEAFSYSVSHDLRAPLRGIAGFAQALEEHADASLDDTARGYLMRVRRAADRMGNLIDDLLKLSRLTRAEMNLQKVNLSDMAESILTQLKQREPDRQIKWKISPEVTVHADAALMRILLENLLENAWKFTSKKADALIELGAQIGTESEQVCYVRDNGVGFDMRYASKLFGAFQRLHSMVEYPGTGIGLATVQRVVRRHGGRVWADAKLNVGSTFYFVV